MGFVTPGSGSCHHRWPGEAPRTLLRRGHCDLSTKLPNTKSNDVIFPAWKPEQRSSCSINMSPLNFYCFVSPVSMTTALVHNLILHPAHLLILSLPWFTDPLYCHSSLGCPAARTVVLRELVRPRGRKWGPVSTSQFLLLFSLVSGYCVVNGSPPCCTVQP